MALVSRTHAGLRLAHALTAYASRSDVTVVAVRLGAVPLALATAKALRVPGDYYGVSPILISARDHSLSVPLQPVEQWCSTSGR